LLNSVDSTLDCDAALQPVILVTGATGFVGSALIARLSSDNVVVRAAVRREAVVLEGVGVVKVGDLSPKTDWCVALHGVDAVVHAAARVHVMADAAADPLSEFRCANVGATLNLAHQAAKARVRRFVFISSIKVNGDCTANGRGYTPDDIPNPSDPYGVSKHEAEVGLRRITEETGMEVVIIRPVLVYGPGVKGNFLAMMRWLYGGIPLPLGAINNSRSLVALDNLVDLVVTCLHHPAAANQTFLVSDGEDLSTTELLKRTASAMGVMARLISVPASFVQTGTRLLGKSDIGQRLCGSLQVDISKTRKLLGWTPLVTVDQALKRTAEYFLRNQLVE
jgi:nucleoside-diphosphate-sugar epimerase